MQPYRLESCCEAQVLTWNVEFVSIAQETGSKVFSTLPPECHGDAQSEGDGLNVCLLGLN